jgi:hypothetical protein
LVLIAEFGINFFLLSFFHFSLVKAMMNFPHLCKLCKDYLTGNGHGIMVLEMPPFLRFPISNGGTKTIAQLPIAEE